MTKKELLQLLEGVGDDKEIFIASDNFHSLGGGVYELSDKIFTGINSDDLILSICPEEKKKDTDSPRLGFRATQIWDTISETDSYMSALLGAYFKALCFKKTVKGGVIERFCDIISYMDESEWRPSGENENLMDIEEKELDELYKAFMLSSLTQYLTKILSMDMVGRPEKIKYNGEPAILTKLHIIICGKRTAVEQIKKIYDLDTFYQWDDHFAFTFLDAIRELVKGTAAENDFNRFAILL